MGNSSIENLYGIDDIEVDETHVWWVSSVPGPGDGEFVTAKASPKPTSVQVDEHALYWSTADEESGQGGLWMLCKPAL